MLVVNVNVNGEDMDLKVKKITDENGDVKYATPIVSRVKLLWMKMEKLTSTLMLNLM